MISRRYSQLLRSRTETIAQTEVNQAANEAQRITFESAVREGEIDTNVYVMEWVARTIACPRCVAMDGAWKEITSGSFTSDGTGPKGIETSPGPNLHPNCHCITRLIPRADVRTQTN